MDINPKIHIAPAKYKSLGLFAKQLIKKGELIFVLNGVEFIVEDDYSNAGNDEKWFQIGDKTWLDDKNYGGFLNHSCNPNSAVFNLINLKSLKEIKPGEEIKIDYDAIDWDVSKNYPFVCRCGEKNCRGSIRGYKYLPDIWKRFYKKLGIIPKYLLELEEQQSQQFLKRKF